MGGIRSKRYKILRKLQMSRGLNTFQHVRCITRDDNRPILETKVLELSILANKVTSIVCCECSFNAVVESVMSFRAAFKKQHGASFLAVGAEILECFHKRVRCIYTTIYCQVICSNLFMIRPKTLL